MVSSDSSVDSSEHIYMKTSCLWPSSVGGLGCLFWQRGVHLFRLDSRPPHWHGAPRTHGKPNNKQSGLSSRDGIQQKEFAGRISVAWRNATPLSESRAFPSDGMRRYIWSVLMKSEGSQTQMPSKQGSNNLMSRKCPFSNKTNPHVQISGKDSVWCCAAQMQIHWDFGATRSCLQLCV